MANINFASREVNCKIVFYGPGRSGKTTNLEVIHAKAPKDSVSGDLVSIATETDRTLFFDFLPIDLGTVAGMKTKFQLYTVPGQVYYNATRKLVLQGADGVVFVADSQKSMREENVESLNNLIENLAECGLRFEDLALVLQWNKRDLEDIDTPEYMNEYLNRWNCPSFEAVAVNGDGVFKTLKSIASQVIKKLNQETGVSSGPVTSVPMPAPAKPKAAPATSSSPPIAMVPPPPPAAARPVTPAPPPPAAKTPPPPAVTAPPPAPKVTPAPPPPAAHAAPSPAPSPALASAPAAAPAPVPVPAPTVLPTATPPVTPPATPVPSPSDGTGKTKGTTIEHPSHPEGDMVKKELERKRAEREAQEKANRERIQRSARKPIKQGDSSKLLMIIGLITVIGIAAGVVYYFLTK